ncbi:heterokaryon incompatibility protein [Colletotrichum karsti]|uniref:Heterokaryon incompatibility protein n=1 Tax=Colletotrichum karsti TaxID=1095194 RepID=A0A9P6LGQ5_9PEZI|nr:heterokaryon incompatibility protein [Colletotrichum karsti]KAF9872773.1 heterokaryon incompatibility protein [Colletotrichum karsti]
MDDWHDSSCKKPDILAGEGFVSCLKCGSYGTAAEATTSGTGDDSTAMPRPIYEPLEEKTDIRLLKVEPGEFEDPIQCSIFLSSTTSQAEYEAISYTWGGEDNNMGETGSIRLGEKTFCVTPNCESALRHIRSKFTRKTVWIDAICINQDDVNERGHQVRVMPQIYSGARQVLIYIGEASPQDQELFNFLSGKPDDCTTHWQLQFTVVELLKRRYFSRVWILQEIALARKATLICGQNALPWSSMRISWLVELSLLSSPPDMTQLPPALSLRAPAYRDSSNLLDLLDLARKSQATDPRDKVFAVYGLMFLAEKDGLVADYTKSTEDVFIDVATWIARSFGLPALLARTVDVNQPDENAEADMHQWDNSSLPMWVPDWTKRTTPYTYQNSYVPGLTLRYGWDLSLMAPKIQSARMSPFIRICRESIAFTGFKLGSISNVVQDVMEPGESRNGVVSFSPWNYFELCLDEHGSLRPKSIKEHIITPASLAGHRYYERSCIYLVPEPADYGAFLFEEPGLVSVRFGGDGVSWTHVSPFGITTTGRFANLAVCCWESDAVEARTICGMLYLARSWGTWETGQFETVVASQAFLSSWIAWGRP